MIGTKTTELVARIRDSDRVLDVGGWHAPFNRANVVIDIMPYETRNRKGAILPEVWPEERFDRSTFLNFDLCIEPWPFPDKYFDFIYCAHTLEDLRDPLAVCREINRVGTGGYIEVPSRFCESTKGVERPFYCGYYHHRWLCEEENGKLVFLFKPAQLHAYSRFHFRLPWFKKLNPRHSSLGFFWKESFAFEERILIDRNEVQENLLEFKSRLNGVPDLFLRKYDWFGRRI